MITASISVLVIGLFIISISSLFNFRRLNFSKNLSIYAGVAIELFTIVSYNPLYFCIVCCNLSFVDLIFLFSFLDESGQKFESFIYLLKNQLLVLLIFTIGISLEGMILKLKLQYFGHLMQRVDSLEDSDAGRDWGQEEKGMTEDEMAGWHH